MNISPLQETPFTQSVGLNSAPSSGQTPQQSIRPCDTLSSAEEPEGCCAWVVSLVIGVFKAFWSFCFGCFGSEQSDEVEPSRREWRIPDMSDMIGLEDDLLLVWVITQEQNGKPGLFSMELADGVRSKENVERRIEDVERRIKSCQDQGREIISLHCFAVQIFEEEGKIKFLQKWITKENLQLVHRAEDEFDYKLHEDDQGYLGTAEDYDPLGNFLSFTLFKHHRSFSMSLKDWLVEKMLKWA